MVGDLEIYELSEEEKIKFIMDKFKYRRSKYINNETIRWLIDYFNGFIDYCYELDFEDCLNSEGYYVVNLKKISIHRAFYRIYFTAVIGDVVINDYFPLHHKVKLSRLYYSLRDEFPYTELRFYN